MKRKPPKEKLSAVFRRIALQETTEVRSLGRDCRYLEAAAAQLRRAVWLKAVLYAEEAGQ